MSELLSLVPEHGFPRFVFDAVWQSTLIGLVAAVALRYFVRRPAVRSWLAVLACALCVMTPCATLAVRLAGVGLLPAATVSTAPAVNAAVDPIVAGPTDVPGLQPNLTPPVEPSAMEEVANNPAPAVESVAVAVPEQSLASERTPAIQRRANPWLAFGVIWCTVAIALFVRFGRSVLGLLRICRDARRCEDTVLLRSSDKAAALLSLAQSPQVLVSEHTSCPAVVSWLRPKLIVPPVKRVLGEDHWVAVFAHELAHVQRRDGWARLLTELAVMAMPWQPLLWWLRNTYHESSEHACDDWAIFAGADPVDFASALTDWIPRQQPALALGIGGWPHLIRRRIERLLKDRLPANPGLGRGCRLGTTALAAAVIGFTALAQQGAFSATSEITGLPIEVDSASTARPINTVFGDGRLCHWNTARVLGFGPDSKTVLSSSRDRTLMRWNTRTGKPAGKRILPLAVTGRWLDWPVDVRRQFSTDEIATPDGRSFVQSMANGDIRVVEIASGSFRTLEHRVDLPLKLRISQDGQTLAVLRSPAEERAAIDVIDFGSGLLVRTISRQFDRDEDQIRPDRWQGMTLSPDGSLLAVGRRERVSVFDTSSGKELWHEQANASDPKAGMVGVLCFSSDGMKLASGGWVRNATNGAELTSFQFLRGMRTAVSRSIANHVAFDPSGNLLALANGSSLRVWDTVNNRQKWVVQSRDGQSYSSVRFSPNQELLAASCGNEIVLLNTGTGKRTSASQVSRVESVATSPTDSQLLLGLTTGQIESVELETLNKTRWDAHERPVNEIVFSPDGKSAASVTSNRLALHDPHASRMRQDVEFENRRRSSIQRPSQHPPIAYSSDGSQLFSFPAQPDRSPNRLLRWSLDGEQLAPLKMPGIVLPYSGLTSTSHGELLMLSRDARPTLAVWDEATADRIKDLERLFPRLGGRLQVATTRTSDKIAFGARADAFRVYVRAKDAYVDLRKGHRRGTLRALAFHPEGRLLASAAEDGRVVIWDTETSNKLVSIKIGPRAGVISALGWTHDGKSFVTRNANGTASIHAVDTESLLTQSGSGGQPGKAAEPAD